MKIKLTSDVFVNGKMRKKDEILSKNDVSDKDFKTLIVNKTAIEVKEEPKKEAKIEPKEEPKAPKTIKKDEKID